MKIDIPIEVLAIIKNNKPSSIVITSRFCHTEVHEQKMCGKNLELRCASEQQAMQLSQSLSEIFRLIDGIYIGDFQI
jgi:hypothetical protein